MNEDAVVACGDLVGRAGASGFEIGFMNQEATTVAEAEWYAVAYYQGARISADGHQSPSGAALALAEQILRGAGCKCGKPVALSGTDRRHCRWRLMGRRWEPGCNAPTIRVKNAKRGDTAAIFNAYQERLAAPPANRAERRGRILPVRRSPRRGRR